MKLAAFILVLVLACLDMGCAAVKYPTLEEWRAMDEDEKELVRMKIANDAAREQAILGAPGPVVLPYYMYPSHNHIRY